MNISVKVKDNKNSLNNHNNSQLQQTSKTQKTTNTMAEENNFKLIDAFIKLMEKVYSDYILINRIIYKVKNQFRRQKQFKKIVEVRKRLRKLIFENFVDVMNGKKSSQEMKNKLNVKNMNMNTNISSDSK
jgi:hypothetical protein